MEGRGREGEGEHYAFVNCDSRWIRRSVIAVRIVPNPSLWYPPTGSGVVRVRVAREDG